MHVNSNLKYRKTVPSICYDYARTPSANAKNLIRTVQSIILSCVGMRWRVVWCCRSRCIHYVVFVRDSAWCPSTQVPSVEQNLEVAVVNIGTTNVAVSADVCRWSQMVGGVITRWATLQLAAYVVVSVLVSGSPKNWFALIGCWERPLWDCKDSRCKECISCFNYAAWRSLIPQN